MLMGAKAVFAIDGVLKEKGVKRSQGECHVATKEDEEANTREVLKEIGCIGKEKNSEERELAEKNGEIEESNIN